MKPIRFAHVKAFETAYTNGNLRKPKWVTVTLQVIVDDQREASGICAELAAHMDTPLPRFLVLTEQTFGELTARAISKKSKGAKK